MSELNRSTLKSYFETGDRPTEEEFAGLIDSQLNKVDDQIKTARNPNNVNEVLVGIGFTPQDTIDNNFRLNVKGNLKVQGSTVLNPANAVATTGLRVLVIDNNGEVKTAPQNQLDDSNWSRNGLHIFNSNTGNVGIGTANPQKKLHLSNGEALIEKYRPLGTDYLDNDNELLSVKGNWYPGITIENTYNPATIPGGAPKNYTKSSLTFKNTAEKDNTVFQFAFEIENKVNPTSSFELRKYSAAGRMAYLHIDSNEKKVKFPVAVLIEKNDAVDGDSGRGLLTLTSTYSPEIVINNTFNPATGPAGHWTKAALSFKNSYGNNNEYFQIGSVMHPGSVGSRQSYFRLSKYWATPTQADPTHEDAKHYLSINTIEDVAIFGSRVLIDTTDNSGPDLQVTGMTRTGSFAGGVFRANVATSPSVIIPEDCYLVLVTVDNVTLTLPNAIGNDGKILTILASNVTGTSVRTDNPQKISKLGGTTTLINSMPLFPAVIPNKVNVSVTLVAFGYTWHEIASSL